MQNKCAEIKIRAERRAGELLKDMQERGELAKAEDNLKQNSGAPKLHDDISAPKQLADIDITPVHSHRWKTLGDIPEEKFEQLCMDLKRRLSCV